jgi:hypothetical protein
MSFLNVALSPISRSCPRPNSQSPAHSLRKPATARGHSANPFMLSLLCRDGTLLLSLSKRQGRRLRRHLLLRMVEPIFFLHFLPTNLAGSVAQCRSKKYRSQGRTCWLAVCVAAARIFAQQWQGAPETAQRPHPRCQYVRGRGRAPAKWQPANARNGERQLQQAAGPGSTTRHRPRISDLQPRRCVRNAHRGRHSPVAAPCDAPSQDCKCHRATFEQPFVRREIFEKPDGRHD